MKQILILKFPLSSLYGGGEQHTITLVEELQRKGLTFFLATSCSVLVPEFRRRRWNVRRWWAGPEPVSIISLLWWPLAAPFAVLGLVSLLGYYRFTKKVRILYCLSLTEKILATVPARLLGMRVIWVEHVTFDRWLTKNPLRPLYRVFSRMTTVVAVSQVIKRQLIEQLAVPADHVVVIYTGVDVNRFSMRLNRWEQAARFNIGCVARLEREKGIEFLIHAVKIIREFVPSVRLIIVGEGSERKKLVWLTERLDLKEAVQWVGRQREVEKWFTHFDAYALPSVTRESFGITLIEAMASGVPTVASRIGGTPEIIDHKVTGLLAEPGNSRDLADQLLFLYNNRSLVRDMVLQARQKVERQFSLERMVRDYYVLFRS